MITPEHFLLAVSVSLIGLAVAALIVIRAVWPNVAQPVAS